MQHARSTLRKIFSDTLRREGIDAPLLAWPLACGAKTAREDKCNQLRRWRADRCRSRRYLAACSCRASLRNIWLR